MNARFVRPAAMAATLFLAACGVTEEPTDVTYDPTWGDSLQVSDGKADFLDLAPIIRFGEAETGEVDSRQLDAYKLELTRGDQIRVTKTVTTGDLSPDFSLFRSGVTSVRSSDFNVSPKSLVKTYTIDSTAKYLIAVRAFRNQGAGRYSIVVECTGGPCAGEFPEPDDNEELDARTIGDCIDDARKCSLDALPRYNGAVGPVRARSVFDGCLEKTGTSDGLSCAKACESDDAKFVCDDIVSSLPFYADQTQACTAELESCMDDCADMDDGTPDEVFFTNVSICFSNGFNGTCDRLVRQLPACGGSLTDETAVCYESCRSISGAWMDDLDTICSDDCGTCGLECSRQLDDLGITVPTTGLVGDVVDAFTGEMDPFAVGDVCVTYVRVHREGDGEFAPGLYGLVEELDAGCAAERFERRINSAVSVEKAMLEPVADSDALQVLNDFQQATYLNLTGSVEPLDLW